MLIRFVTILTCASFVFTTGCRKADTPKKAGALVAANSSSAEKLEVANDPLDLNEAEQIHVVFKKRYDEFFEHYETLSDEEKIEQSSKIPTAFEYIEQWKRLAKEHPGTPTAASAYAWLCIYGSDVKEEAMKKMFGEYINSRKLKDVCLSLSIPSIPSKAVEERLELAIQLSPHSEVQGTAKLSLAQNLMYVREMCKYAKHAGKGSADKINDFYGPELGSKIRDYLKDFDSAAAQSRAIQLLESVVANHAEHKIERLNFESLGKIAKRQLFELKQLAMGQVAPEIVGKDLDGLKFKLSDYRGKVVLLSFWGDW